VSTNAARGMATSLNRVLLGPRHKGVAERGGANEKMVDVEEEEEATGDASDVTIAETETVPRTATDTNTENETRALAPG